MRFLKLTLLIILISIPVYSEFDINNVVLSNSTTRGINTIHKIERSRLISLPKWDSKKELSPVFTIFEASAKSRKWLQKKYPKIENFRLRKISLERIGYESVKSDWFYKVVLQPIIGEQFMFGTNYTVVVLLNGEIVEPIVTKK